MRVAYRRDDIKLRNRSFIQSRWSSTCGFSFLARGNARIKHFDGRQNFLSRLYAGIDNNSLTIEHYIAGGNHPTGEVGFSARDIFGEFKRAHLKDMLIKVNNHNLAALFLGSLKTCCNTFLTHYALAVAQLTVNSVLRILVSKRHCVSINDDVDIGK